MNPQNQNPENQTPSQPPEPTTVGPEPTPVQGASADAQNPVTPTPQPQQPIPSPVQAAPQPTPVSPQVPPQVPGQPQQPMQPAAQPLNPKSLKKTIILIIVGIVALMVIGFGAFTFLGNSATTYSKLENQKGEGFTIDVPAGWESENEGGLTVYFDPELSETADDAQALVFGANLGPLGGWSSYTSSEKTELWDEAFETTKADFEDSVPESFSEWQIKDSDRSKHPSAEESYRIYFEGTLKTGQKVKGEYWGIVNTQGDLHLVMVAAESSIWDRNQENFKKISDSYRPS